MKDLTADDVEARMNDLYDAALLEKALMHDLIQRWTHDDPHLKSRFWLFIVAFVGACQRIEALTAERDEVRNQFLKIGRKAFWASNLVRS